MTTATKKISKLDFLITGRGYAITAVFIGHLLSPYYGDGNHSLLPAGHAFQVGLLPFFIVLSGAFYARVDTNFASYFKLKVLQRYLPVLFFSAIVLPLYFYVNNDMYRQAMRFSQSYLLGIPTANWPTWFLIALMTAELFYYFINKQSLSRKQSLIFALALYCIGWALNYYKFQFDLWVFGLSMVWMIGSVPLFLSCMIVGNTYRKDILKISRWTQKKLIITAAISFAVLLIFSNLNTEFPQDSNQGLLKYVSNTMVQIFIGQYGNGIYFFISGGAGVVFCLMMSKLLPANRLMRSIGEHSLILFCMNGAFHHSLNDILTKTFALPADTLFWGVLYSSVLGTLSVIACLPIAILLQRYLPQLVGKPMLKGPILPAIYRK